MDRKVYDFSVEQASSRLVSFLRSRHTPSSVADLVAGTGLPTHQVAVAMRSVVHEYGGHLQVGESGELAYYFPAGMRSTLRGFRPAFHRGLRAFLRAAGRVLSFLFKIWIVAMLVGYFLLFIALALLAVFVSVAASGASKDRGRRRGDGGGLYLATRLLDLVLRMWFWSSVFGGGRRRREPGRPLYRSVFAFVFGEDDPNRGYQTELRRYAIAFIRAHRGIISLEEAMAMTGLEASDAEQLLNRWAVEFEGEPKVTEQGSLYWSFPELLRSSAEDQRAFAEPPAPPARRTRVFSSNKPGTNGWLVFFDVVNLVFGGYFLFVSLAPEAAARLGEGFIYLYRLVSSLAAQLVVNPAALLGVALGAIPLAFSMLFILIPLVRQRRLRRENEAIRTHHLARRIFSHVLAQPSRANPDEVRPLGSDADPSGFPRVRQRIFDRLAGWKGAEPQPLPDGGFAYRFAEIEREQADLEALRATVDVGAYATGKPVFDSGR